MPTIVVVAESSFGEARHCASILHGEDRS